MTGKLYIANSQIVFSYRRNIDMRKRVFEFEDYLKGEFITPFKTLAVPDEIDPNIPRFESQSVHLHSRLQVSQVRIALATSYDEKFKQNYAEVRDYLRKRCEQLSFLVKKEEMNFVAYIIELGVHMQEDEINPFIKKNTGTIAISNDCKDFSLMYSKVFKDDYYLNITCSKFHEQELKLHLETKQLRPTGNNKYGISAMLDINSRPFFERSKKFDESLYENILNETFVLLENKGIEDFLNGNI